MRAAHFIFPLLAVLALAAGPAALSVADEANFYATPGETPRAFALNYSNFSLFYLVVINGSAVALLEVNGSEFTAILDYDELAAVLYSNEGLLLNATGKDAETAVLDMIKQAKRSDVAFKRKAIFLRESELASFQLAWANLTREYSFPRKLSLPLGDGYANSMQAALSNLRESKTARAQEEYSRRFDESHAKAVALQDAYLKVLVSYRASALALANATEKTAEGRRRGFISAGEAERALREVAVLEAKLIDAESLLVDGRHFTESAPAILEQIAANATRIAASSLTPRPAQDTLPVYAGAVLLLASCAGLAFLFRDRLAQAFEGTAQSRKEMKEDVAASVGKVVDKLKKIDRL